jgi:prevent-host-death family protein
MAEIGAYEAKTHLPQLLERVLRGERFVITRHGKPVAELAPYAGHDRDAAQRTVAEMRALRRSLEKRGFTLASVLEPGESLRDLAHRHHRY